MSEGLVRILEGNTFVVSDRRGDIEASPTDPGGLFAWDTRFLSRWVLTVDGSRLTALSTDDLNYFEARFFLVLGTSTVYVNADLTVIRQRAVGHGFRESITLLNHHNGPVDLTLRMDVACDFVDLFEVKDALAKQGTRTTRVEDGALVISYDRDTFHRDTTVSASSPASRVHESGLEFDVHLEAHGSWSTELYVAPRIGRPDVPSLMLVDGVGPGADRSAVAGPEVAGPEKDADAGPGSAPRAPLPGHANGPAAGKAGNGK